MGRSGSSNKNEAKPCPKCGESKSGGWRQKPSTRVYQEHEGQYNQEADSHFQRDTSYSSMPSGQASGYPQLDVTSRETHRRSHNSMGGDTSGRSNMHSDYGRGHGLYAKPGHRDEERPGQDDDSNSKNFFQWLCEKLKIEDPSSKEILTQTVEKLKCAEQEICWLRDRLGEKSQAVENYAIGLHTEQEHHKKLKESTNKLMISMENKDLFFGRQDTDDAVSSQFSQLIGRIKTWSVTFAQNDKISLPDLSYVSKEDLKKIGPGVKHFDLFLRKPKNLRLFVRAWVSLTVTEMLVRTLPCSYCSGSEAEDIWMERELAHAVHVIEMYLLHSDPQTTGPKDVHDWRAFTTSLISKAYTPSEVGQGQQGVLAQCNERIFNVIGPLAPRGQIEQLTRDLSGILLQAVKLSKTIRCQRALWSLRHVVPETDSNDAPVLFDGSIMEDDGGDGDDRDDDGRSPRSVVEIVVSPALFKRGNTDGGQYDVETCIDRAKVRSFLPTNVVNPYGFKNGTYR